jgi:hypothetical protein
MKYFIFNIKEVGLVHSNAFPDVFQEKVALLIKYQDTRIVYETVLDITKKVTVQEFKHVVREVRIVIIIIFRLEISILKLN